MPWSRGTRITSNPPIFNFVSSKNLIHVLSEKEFMPYIYDVYSEFKQYFGETALIRLMGGNRQDIEVKAGEEWNKIIDPKPDLMEIIAMIKEMMASSKSIIINVNNHYEGSAPLTIQAIKTALEGSE
jgi:uncharacterized protein YecE (DUF72 family)